jgi:hypothetical protein
MVHDPGIMIWQKQKITDYWVILIKTHWLVAWDEVGTALVNYCV